MKTSVAICTYNGSKYIREQLDSIIDQSTMIDEIVICDDNSTDNTIEIINEYLEKFPKLISLHQNKINLKSVKNFEKAISLCTGAIIFLADQDDKWVNTKVEKYIAFFLENPKIDCLASNGFCMDEHSNLVDTYTIWDMPKFLQEKIIGFAFNQLITKVGNFITGASIAFRKEIVKDLIPFPIVKGVHHDEWIAMVSSKDDKLAFLNEKLFYYRIHSNQQVGGVSYKKTEINKDKLVQKYNLNTTDLSFFKLKKRIHYLTKAHERNLGILKYYNFDKPVLNENLKSIEADYYKYKDLQLKKYPIQTFFMNSFNVILKRKKFEPYQF